MLTFDARGNGLSDRPVESPAYAEREHAADALAVLDATGTTRAVIVSSSLGAQRSLLLAAEHPERIEALVFIGPTVPLSDPPYVADAFEDVREEYVGWEKYNANYWRSNWPDFVQWFIGDRCFTEPHSTKQIEDCVSYGLETNGETLVTAFYGQKLPDREAVLELCARVRCPVLVLHGEQDAITAVERGRHLAEATGGTFVPLPGWGHLPHARHPVAVNLLVDEFVSGPPEPVRRRLRDPRVLVVTSPIGLGHAQRDLAIVRELRRLRPGLEVEWLAQHPVTAVLEAAGETVHPASAQLANESAAFEAHARDHELHAFQAWRGLDEVLVANFMLFNEVAHEGGYDLWLGDEAWEVDYFLHENPELKTTPYVFVTDFVGWLPASESEEWLTSDYNAENIGHVEGNPGLRDLAIFIGDREDVIPCSFGPGLPAIDDWVPKHFEFPGYVAASAAEPVARPDGAPPLIVASVGGSTAGSQLLRRIAAAFAELRRDTDAELLVVCGPRLDPGAIDPSPGMEVVGYVHDLHRVLASCDLAVVQGGLTTTMELVAACRPFISVPLRTHFEQNGHVAHRLRRYGAPEPTPWEATSPQQLAALMRARLGSAVDYRPVDPGGAARAAALIAPLIRATT